MKDVYISPILNIRIKLSNDSRIKERRTNLQIPIDLVHVALEDYLPIKIRERIYGLLQRNGVLFSIDERGDHVCGGDKLNNRIEIRMYQLTLDSPFGFSIFSFMRCRTPLNSGQVPISDPTTANDFRRFFISC